ncbi:MAG: Ig-like domain-containing protein [Vicinamibacterales bacterium]
MDQYFRNWWHRHGRAVACFQSVALALCLSALAPTQAESQTNLPPTVALTAPADGSSAPVGADVVVFAAAADQNGSVVRVDFYAGGTLIASDTSAPFWIVWNTSVPGDHVLTAVARDNNGATTTSAPVTATRTSSSNLPPVVSLAANASAYEAPASINLRANASDADGTISRVDFFANGALILSDFNSSYRATWQDVGPGTHTLTARAWDNAGGSTLSAPVVVTVSGGSTTNAPPVVAMTAPVAGSSLESPASVTLGASATDADGTVVEVQFFVNGSMVGWAASAPYAIPWSPPATGTYSIRATARDDDGETTASATIQVTITAPNAAPAVILQSPGSGHTAPATIPLAATASDSDGSVVRVDFLAGGSVVASDTSAPFEATWSGVAAGTYVLTAVAYDDRGAITTSNARQLVVAEGTNLAPAVVLTAPTSASTFTAPAGIALAAAASDTDGAVASVAFYAGSVLLGTDTSAPFTVTWTNVAAGSYTITAVASDDRGATTTSSPVSVTVSAATGNAPPTVTLAANAANWEAPTTVNLRATAADGDGSIARVDFFVGSTLISSDPVASYRASWPGTAAGTYTLTAVAYDNQGAATTSAPVTVTLTGTATTNQPPVVSLETPLEGDTYLTWASVIVLATASDPGGSVNRVDFYVDQSLVHTATSAPYWFNWTNMPVGTHTVRAVARDNTGLTAASQHTVSVVSEIPNQLPTVALLTPAQNERFFAPATIELSAAANDADGTVSQVQFFSGSTLLLTDGSQPFTRNWTNVPSGTYVITAVAKDDRGATVTSTSRTIVVEQPPPPTTAVFEASTNHDTAVDYYVLEVFTAGADPSKANPLRQQNLGKPAVFNGEVSADIAATVLSLPAGLYRARVTAVGPFGTTNSSLSKEFVR